MTDRNEATYRASNIVRYYTQLELLQPAEAAILEKLKPELSSMKMLDIGIGGGRTTKHFAPLVDSYIGIDYSPEMIAACKKRFKTSPQWLLEVGDARSMESFADNSFDFIFFSFNGIDYVDHGDRLKILKEISRIGKPGSYVLFSSHNLQAMVNEFTWQAQFNKNPIKTYENLIMLGILRFFNSSVSRQKLLESPYLILRDESHNFNLQTYYIRAEEQLKQLKNSFFDIEIYPWQSSKAISDLNELINEKDLWLYYFCRIR